MKQSKGKLEATYNINTELLTLQYIEPPKKPVMVSIYNRPNEEEARLANDIVECWSSYDELSRRANESEAALDKYTQLACEEAQGVKAVGVKVLEMIQAVKVRIAFIGWPKEPMNEDGPDWSKEIPMLDSVEALVKTTLTGE